MEIETYEVEENVDKAMAPAIEAEALAQIEKLGLKGQQKLVVKNPAGADERIPYPEMSRHEKAVYETLFPEKTKVEDYDSGIIPVRVLQVIGHATGLFDRVEVWHKPMRDPDPILVAKLGEKYHLLARWGGEALKSFPVLVKEARALLQEDYERRIEATAQLCKTSLATIKSLVEDGLNGRWVHIPQ